MPPAPRDTVEESLPWNVKELLTAKVLPSLIVNVEPFAGVVMVNLLIVLVVALRKFGLVNVAPVESTAEPDPVVVDICVPLILNTLPVPAVSNVLLVNVAVVAPVIKVPVSAGRVRVPEAAALACNCVLPELDPSS